MSNQPPQRVRRNVSPSTKQGPMKAVQAFSLKKGSPTRCSNSSPTANLRTDSHKIWSKTDNRHSPERRSPNSPSCKGSDKKSHRQSPVPNLWRAGSLDTIGPYLTGQWPKDINSYHHYQSSGIFMCDKSTQTTEEWEAVCNEKKRSKKGHKRSASFGHGDQLKEFRQRLQQSRGSKQSESNKQRQSPVQGNHSALSLTAPPTVFSQSKAIVIPSSANAVHIPRTSMSRFQRNSVEGLNTEIEKLVLTKDSGNESDEIEVPDGHRAPLPEISRISSTRSIDTQTPSALTDEGCNSSSCSRSDSISPAIPIIPGDLSRPSSRGDSVDSKLSDKGDIEFPQDTPSPSITKFVSSPKPDDSCDFVRKPPDGCEKVKVMDETRNPTIKEPLLFSVKPNKFVFKQSAGSAFCPPYKSFLHPPVQPAGIEGQ